jgi:cytochrome c553
MSINLPEQGPIMIKKLLTVSISLLLATAAGHVNAQGNASAGKTKAASCAGCHGEDGNSTMPTFPKLAGQHQTYLVKQLQAFKSGARLAPMMAPLAAGLDDQTIQELASYYAGNKISTNPAPKLPPSDDDAPAKTAEQEKAELDALITKGSDLYRNGNISREVSACVACHGPYAEGNKPASFPSLHSQHADYLIKSLTDFKIGARSNNRENMMHMIATKMTDEDIKAVAYYISTMK